MKAIFFISVLTYIQTLGDSLAVAADTNKHHDIYLVKSAWHVGILIRIDSLSSSMLPVLSSFREYSYVDMGWGDEDFYQADGINYFYAVKAALIPTSSVIKVTGHYGDLNDIIRWSDFAIKIRLDSEVYVKLLRFIDDSFLNEGGKRIVTKKEVGGAIKFYKSTLSYSLIYTCNTWVADALKHAGLDIDPNEIITSDQLYYNTITLGEVLK